ncbi:hypothetical protein [Aestuariivirga sp.]|uniref:hypothetical protein n=1 Tax=Aestuariivirga sp. TaxID=2650926 RepID=UPI0039E27D23
MLFSAAALAGVGITLLAQPALSANPAFCALYAQKAVKQQKKNINMDCGFHGPRWQMNYDAHFAWCLGVPPAVADAETQARVNQLASCTGDSGGGGPPAQQTFTDPKYQGMRLDWCFVWGNQCGAPAANAYCQYRGFSSAMSFGEAQDIGNFTSTKVMGTGQVCNGPFCDGFTFITCH